ncbi:MAG: ArsC/Spx/MgsR family protein [Methylocystis sp.]|jgi:nitrogenase-associated protein
MAQVIFYENPACAEHARLKALLTAAGHTVEVRDLMSEPWSASSLRPFFAEKSIQDWFDTSSPRIKSGEIDLQKINPQSALVAMILDPSLIRAPLMRIGDRCESGFDPERIQSWIGLTPLQAQPDPGSLAAAARIAVVDAMEDKSAPDAAKTP